MSDKKEVRDSFTAIIDNEYGLREHTDYGELMTIRKFIEYCDSGGFIDYDGYGHLATLHKESRIEIIPSKRRKTITLNPWATHVMWFNR